MSDFGQHLSNEIEKRSHTDSSDSFPDIDSDRRKKRRSLFSFSAFFKGLIVCSLFTLALISWAWFKSDQTTQAMIDKMASKTAIVNRDASIYRLGDAQPVLRMPSGNSSVTLPEKEAVELPKTELSETENKEDIDLTLTEEPPKVTPVAATEQPQNGGGLVAAPVPGLYEAAVSGLLPVIRKEDNLTPFQAYKRPFEKKSDKPLLSIVFFNVGLSQKVTRETIENFPAEVSFSFSPYARDLKLLSDEARADGHEVWLTLPLETKNYPLNDPGPSTLFVNASVEQNSNRLSSLLASTQGYAGFISQKEHVFKREDARVNPSVEEIFKRGLAIVDSNPSLYSFVGDVAARNDYPHAKNNFWLDDDLSPLALNKKIRKMIEYGESGGNVVVMLRPYPASIKALQKFLNSAAADTFQLAPVSAQVTYGE